MNALRFSPNFGAGREIWVTVIFAAARTIEPDGKLSVQFVLLGGCFVYPCPPEFTTRAGHD